MPADDLRTRLIDAELAVVHELTPEGRPNFLMRGNIEAADLAIAVLAELATDPGDLLERMIEAAKPAFAGRPPSADGVFALDSTRNPWTALKDALTAALSVRWEHATHLAARLAEAERRAEHFESELASVRDHNTRWEREKARADRAEAEVRRLSAFRDEVLGDLAGTAVERDKAKALVAAAGDQIGDVIKERNRAQAQVAALQRELEEARDERDAARLVSKGRTMGQYDALDIYRIHRQRHPSPLSDCIACSMGVAISRDMPSRPDDPEEIQRLAGGERQ